MYYTTKFCSEANPNPKPNSKSTLSKSQKSDMKCVCHDGTSILGCFSTIWFSCWIALNRADKKNGCMQVLKGSHHVGRIDHVVYSGQNCAEPERVEQLLKNLELVYCELEAGSAMFFHCNTLHRSDANTSERNRWNLICCYNMAKNNPYIESLHPKYTPLEKVSNSAIKEAGLKLSNNSDSFYKPDEHSIRLGHTAR